MNKEQYESKLTSFDAQFGIGIPRKEDSLPNGVVLICGSSITPKPIAWLW